MLATATSRPDVKSFSLAQPFVDATSGFELTAFALLSLTAVGVWLLLLPLELLSIAAS
jgi:hypothetical protein